VEWLVDVAALRPMLAGWYRANGRRLAFRGAADPWGVLVSEVMLQQTQVARVVPAWERFMTRFPTPGTLAAAGSGEALRAWTGLGYNRRALNLWRAAEAIVSRHGGSVPADVDALRALPGIGPYTARAVAAIAFGRPVAAVDTNVRRVVTRVAWGQAADSLSAPHPATDEVQAAADDLLDGQDPAAWTHAVMDLGATLCRPRNPACPGCPIRSACRFALVARTVGSPRRPRRRSPTAVPFAQTPRWLRGRIVDRLRAAVPGAWVSLEGGLGAHDAGAVRMAVETLAAEGLLELGKSGQARLRWTDGRAAAGAGFDAP
jgi:A/G-specific adenine glycosylase